MPSERGVSGVSNRSGEKEGNKLIMNGTRCVSATVPDSVASLTWQIWVVLGIVVVKYFTRTYQSIEIELQS